MGTFHVSIEVSDPEWLRFQSMEALVDTGATFLTVLRDMLASLDCGPMESRPLALADDHIVEYEVGTVSLRLNGRAIPVLCVFGDASTIATAGGDRPRELSSGGGPSERHPSSSHWTAEVTCGAGNRQNLQE